MNKLLKNLIATTAIAVLAACGGGGGNAGTSPFGGGAASGASASTADLIVTLDSAQVANTGSASATVSVTAIDAARNTLAGIPVAISADGDAVVTVTSPTTGTDGVVSAKIGIGSNKGNRVITVTATSGAISKTATLQVVGTAITSVLVPAVIAPSTAGQIQYHVVDQAGNAMIGQDVQIVATGLTPDQAVGTTGANGDFVFSYTSPATVGAYTVSANIGGKTDTQTLQVQTTSTVPAVPVGTAIASASVSANPSVVPVNLAGSQTNRAEIRALFLGSNNLPIPNVRVRFDLNGDVNSIGGTFTTGATTLFSDSNGIVTTAYVPAVRSSPTDGVTIRACYGKNDTDPNLINCTTAKLVTLTVTSEPLGVAIGTNELVIVNELTYVKKLVISVSDSAGNAKPDVNLVVSVDLPNYRKGFYTAGQSAWIKTETAICANEDTNRNGVLDPGEDVNGDGQLWPRKPDVIISLLQSKTGADGTAEVEITYAKDHGSWVDAFITVSASGVSGSEGRVTYLFAPVPVDSASIKNVSQAPAYIVSPYGIAASCANPN
jgi:hypothetical protein